MVFSSGAVSWEGSSNSSEKMEKEKCSKCKMYVEPVEESSNGRVGANFYLVLETHGKTTWMTELQSGGATWLPNPRSLEDRNSLAKLLFQADCKDDENSGGFEDVFKSVDVFQSIWD